jgi:hypothetical protein
MERKSVESSNIKSIGYDEATKTLEVEFMKSGVYQYKAVDVQVYDAFMKADSKGKYFAAKVRVCYKCEKIIPLVVKKVEEVQLAAEEILKEDEEKFCTCVEPQPTPVIGKEEFIGCQKCGKEIKEPQIGNA